LDEGRSIAQKLGLSWDRFLDEYTDKRWPGTRSFLLKHQDGACIFLSRPADNQTRLCSIHNFKPACCLEWKADLKNAECREGMQNLWGLTVDPAGRISGSQEKIEQFRLFNEINETS